MTSRLPAGISYKPRFQIYLIFEARPNNPQRLAFRIFRNSRAGQANPGMTYSRTGSASRWLKETQQEQTSAQINAVQNCFEELKQKVPTGKQRWHSRRTQNSDHTRSAAALALRFLRRAAAKILAGKLTRCAASLFCSAMQMMTSEHLHASLSSCGLRDKPQAYQGRKLLREVTHRFCFGVGHFKHREQLGHLQ